MRTFKIITLGCKVNQFESASLRTSLLEAGLTEAKEEERPDVAIVNTCIVTERAACQSRQAIRRAIKENPSGKTAAIGCYAQAFPDQIAQIPGLGLVAGNTVKAQLPAILLEERAWPGPHLVLKDFTKQKGLEYLPVKGFLDRTRAFLKIQDGCQSYCSYCIVPLARGPLRSLQPDKVISGLQSLSDGGHKEVVLTGVHLGKYGSDLDGAVDLEGLLDSIGRLRLALRIRLSSIEPNEIGRGLIEMMGTEDWLCSHFHIPLQSGDNAILRKMNRRYSAEAFASLIENIRREIPYGAIGVDIMAGFPGEDLRAYQNTFSLIRDLPLSYLHVFPFSPRRGTPAAGFPGQVHPRTIKERARRLRSLGQEKRHAFYRSCMGRCFSVLVEGWQSEERGMVKGLSENYLPVRFPSARLTKNSLVAVQVERAGPDGVIGKPLVPFRQG